MEINIITLLYLFFRLAPFIIVCYFSLASLFNQDMKGLIYLVGLLLACFVTFILGETLPKSYTFGTISDTDDQRKQVAGVCNLITIGKDGSLSNIPLGIATLSYTFFYLVYTIVTNNLTNFNIPTFVFFPLLITADFIWNIMNDCYEIFGIILALVAGGGMGVAWAVIISQLNKQLLFLNFGSSQSACSRPSKQLFKCTFPRT